MSITERETARSQFGLKNLKCLQTKPPIMWQVGIGNLEATKASKSLSYRRLSARVRLLPGSVCSDMFVNGLAVTWPVTVVSHGIVPVYRTDT